MDRFNSDLKPDWENQLIPEDYKVPLLISDNKIVEWDYPFHPALQDEFRKKFEKIKWVVIYYKAQTYGDEKLIIIYFQTQQDDNLEKEKMTKIMTNNFYLIVLITLCFDLLTLKTKMSLWLEKMMVMLARKLILKTFLIQHWRIMI